MLIVKSCCYIVIICGEYSTNIIYLGGGQTVKHEYLWQWPENDGTWHDYDSVTQLLLDQLSIGNKITIKAGKWTYDITKTATNSCTYVYL